MDTKAAEATIILPIQSTFGRLTGFAFSYSFFLRLCLVIFLDIADIIIIISGGDSTIAVVLNLMMITTTAASAANAGIERKIELFLREFVFFFFEKL